MLRPRVAITAAIIGIIGVAQYWFIALRTMQGAPYLEARATTIMGVFDVIIARDVSWARFYQAQSAVAAIEVPMLLNGIRVHMGTIPIVLAAIAIVIGIWRRNAEVLLIFGAAAGTLGDDRQPVGRRRRLHHAGVRAAVAAGRARRAGGWRRDCRRTPNGARRRGRRRDDRAGHQCRSPIGRAIELLRTPAKARAFARLYAQLPARSAIVAENYWLARLVNYMHFSGEVAARSESARARQRRQPRSGRRWPTASRSTRSKARRSGSARRDCASSDTDSRGSRSRVARTPAEHGTLFVAARAGRALPFEWLPDASSLASGRAPTIGAVRGSSESRSTVVRSARHRSRNHASNAPDGRASEDHVERRRPADPVGRRCAAADRSRPRRRRVHTGRDSCSASGRSALDETPGVQLAADAVRAARRIALPGAAARGTRPIVDDDARRRRMVGHGRRHRQSRAHIEHRRSRHRAGGIDRVKRPRRGGDRCPSSRD